VIDLAADTSAHPAWIVETAMPGDAPRAIAVRSFKMLELPPEAYAKIKSLCAEGDRLAEAGNHLAAYEKFKEAWVLVPDPKQDWEAATWILAGMGDTLFEMKQYEDAREALQFAMLCPGGLGNPFLHLRLGQAQYQLGNLDRAADELMRAYMGAGPEIFDTEDPVYLKFLATRAEL